MALAELNGGGAVPAPVIADATNPVTLISNLVANANYEFTWAVTTLAPDPGSLCPPSTGTVRVETNADQAPTLAAAGPDQCVPNGTTSITMSATPTTIGTGQWTLVSGPTSPTELVTDPNNPTVTFTGLVTGEYEFLWTTSASACQQQYTDSVEVSILGTASVADAGPDQMSLCFDDVGSTSITMAANTPAAGIGTWVQTIGNAGWTASSGSYPNALNDPEVTFSNLPEGIYEFEWQVVQGSRPPYDVLDMDDCDFDTDRVRFSVYYNPADPNAGVDFSVCYDSTIPTTVNLAADPLPNGSNGTWSVVSGPNTPSLSSATDPNAALTNLVTGIYTFRWTSIATSAICAPKSDEVILTVTEAADAGPDLTFCNTTSFLLIGNEGTVGTWTEVTAFGATITNGPFNTANVVIDNSVNATYTFQYEITSPLLAGCPTTDVMNVVHDVLPTTPNAGTDQVLCTGSIAGSTSATMSANTIVSGSGKWVLNSGPTSPPELGSNDPNVTFTGLVQGLYIFEWEASNGACASLRDVVRVELFDPPSTANILTPDNSVFCQLFSQLEAEAPTNGIGTWQFVGYTGTQTYNPGDLIIDSPNNSLTTLTALNPNTLAFGQYTFTWTVAVAGGAFTIPPDPSACDPSVDTITITYNGVPPATAVAGPDQFLCNLNAPSGTSTNLNASAIYPGDNGLWAVESQPVGSPPVTISSPGNTSTDVSNLVAGVYAFKWSVTNPTAGCVLEDIVEVTVIDAVANANAGTDQVIPQFSPVTLNGIDPSPATGYWSVISGPSTPSFIDPNDSKTQVTGTVPGTYVFLWTVENSPCTTTFDSVEITILPSVDLSLNKTLLSPALPVNVGDLLTFQLTITNSSVNEATNVSLIDELPFGYTLVPGSVDNGGIYNPGGNELLWSGLTVSGGSTLNISYQVNVNAATGVPDEYLNIAEITGLDEFDPDSTPNNRDTTEDDYSSLNIAPGDIVDLELNKIVDNSSPNVGETVTFTIVITNNGPSTATGVEVTDVLPTGYTLVSSSPSAGTYISGTWTIGTINSGITETLIISATVNSSGNYSNTALVSAVNETDSDPNNNQDSATPLPIPIADLSLTKDVDNPAPNVGETVTFTITVNNAGPSIGTNISIYDYLPSGFRYNSHSASNGDNNYNPITGSWTIATLGVGNSATLNVEAIVLPTGDYTNFAEIVGADQNDSDSLPGNNDITEDDHDAANITPINEADLVTTKIVDETNPNEGDTIVYTLTVTNNGPSDATGVSLIDLLPVGLTYVSDDSSGSYNPGDGNWMIGDIASGATATLNITATVDSGTSGGSITNTTTPATGDQSDPTSVGDDLDETISVLNESDIVLTKVVDNSTPNEGDTVTYTITVTNNGPAVATNLVVTDALPVGLIEGLVTPSAGTWSSPNWTIGSLAAGSAETITIEAMVDSGTGGTTITNTASNTQDQTDSNLTADDPGEDITVTSSDLVTVKVVDNNTPNEGDTIVYTLTVTNNGPTGATGVSLVDLLPIGLTYVSDDSSGSYNPGDGNWMIGDIASGATATLNITATVDSGTSGDSITNTTTSATGDQSDPTSVGDDLDETISVLNESDIVLTKVVDNSTPNSGDTVTYTITVTNNGPAVATNLVVTDALPVGLIEGLVTPSAGTWSSPNWTIGSLAAGSAETITIEAEVDSGTGGTTITNTASNTQDQTDSNLTADDPGEDITVTSSDLVTVKVVDNNTPNEGDTIVYTLTVTNNGPSDATGVSLVDLLPIGLTYVSDDSSGSYNPGDGNWMIGDIANGATATLNITATVDSGTSGDSITNTTTSATGDQSDPTSVGDDLDETISVLNESDIVLTKVVDNSTPNSGDNVTYTITVTNNGPAVATNLVVTDALPVGLIEGLVTPSAGTWSSPNWTIGSLAAGSAETITIEAMVDSGTGGTTITNTASNTQDQTDSNLTADDPGEDITVTSSDLVTVKVVDNNTPNEGDTIVYTLTVTNNGTSDATGVSLVDLLPIGLTYVSDDSSGSYNPGDGNWMIGDIANGATATLNITATVDSGTSGDSITNTTTSATGDQSDPTSVGDDLDETISVLNESDIVLTKVVDNSTPNEGDTVTYTITVTNNGPAVATNLVVTDALPVGLIEGLVTPSAGTWSSPNWTIGSLAAGSAETITIEAMVDSGTGGTTITNTASNTQDQTDSNLTADDPGEDITVTSSDLVTVKVVDNNTPNEGDTIVYTLTVTNNGPSDATGVSLVDLLPIGLTYVSDDSSGSYNPGDGNWMIGDIANGATATLNITATVDSGTSGDSITNTTTSATGDQSDPTSVGDDLDETISVLNESDIVLTKVVDNSTPNSGDTVTYTITVTNNGPAVATNLVVTDALPVGLIEGLVTPSAGTWSSPNWTIGSLAAGSAETITIEAMVDSGTGGTTITNTASNTQDQTDSNLTADDPGEDITVTSSDLVTVKVVDNNTPNEGDTIVYTLTVTNNGPSDATGVSLVDLLPIGLTYVSDDSSGSYNPGDGNWMIGDIANGATATLNITATVDSGTSGDSITNTTTSATGDQSDPTSVGDDLDETISVLNESDIVLTKVVDNSTPNSGDNVTYTITVTNNGPAVATNLVVTDALPVGLIEGLVTPSAGTWSSPNWTIGSLAAGSAETITIEAMVDSGTGGTTITNTASNTQDQTDSNLTADDPGEDITVTSSDLVTVKVVDNNTPNEGDTIVYTLTVTNNGPSDATGVSLVDLLPIGLTYVSDDSSGSYNPGDGNWMIGDIANGATATLNITATVDSGTSGDSITNTTTSATGDQSDPTSVGDDLDETISVLNESDIVLTKVVDNSTPNSGDNVTYTITVTNNGPAVATNLVVTDALPVGLIEGLVTPSAGTWSSPNWTIGSLAAGSAETITIEAMVDSGTGGTTITNTASNTQDQTDSNLTADDPGEDITVTSSDLVTVKVVDNNTPNEGDTIVYTLTVTNNGPSDATGVSLVDLLPVGLTYVSDDSSGSYNPGDGNWMIGDIANGATATLNITATVDSGTSGDSITNTTTSATGDQSDPTSVGDDLDETISVLNKSDIVLTKVVDNSTPNSGDTVTYTITVTNNGPAVATNLVVTDALPVGLIEGLVTPSAGTWSSPNWTIGSLAAGSTETITIEAMVDSGTGGTTITNTASNTQDQTDSNLTADDLGEDITVTSSDLVTVKVVDNNTPNEGDTIVYTLTVTNNGPSDATGVNLVDLLPIGLTYVSDDSSGSYNPGDGNWMIGDIANGATATLNITATVDSGTSGDSITNTTTSATGDQSDPTSVGDDLDETISVLNESDIVLTKVVDNSTPNEGDTVTYTITVTNNGPAVATNLVVTDALPVGLIEGLVTPSAGTWSSPNWTIGSLAAGSAETITIEAEVDSGTGGTTITNTASNTQDQTDSNLTADDPGEDITVTSSDLVTVKVVDNNTPNEGDTIVYTLTVTNNGPSDATGVSLVDLLPIGLTYVSDDSSGSYNPGDGNWMIGDIANGATATLNITATVDSGTSGDSITNTTTSATGDQSDPTSVGDDLDETISVLNESDIVLTKVVDNSTPNSGDTVTYTITVTNNGPAVATNLVVTDALPVGLIEGLVTPSAGTWSSPNWTIGSLAAGAAETITIEAMVDSGTGGTTITNTASNTQDQTDSNLTADDPGEDITVTSSDLVTVKVVDNNTPNEGDTIVYTLTVTNNGPSDATGVSVYDVLPVGVTYVSHATMEGAYNSGSGLWNIGNLSGGVTATLDISVTVDNGTVGQTITNTTTGLTADQEDLNPDNNIGSVDIVPTAFIDLSLTKNVVGDVTNPEVGDIITFEIRVVNEGPTIATGVQVTDVIPTGYDFVNYSSSIGTYNPLNGLWNIGFVEIGNTAVLLIDVEVLDSGEFTNCAEITAANETDIDSTPDNGDPDEDDYDCEARVPTQEVDLSIVKTVVDGNLAPLVGDQITFEIILTNTGIIGATEVEVTDLLPTGYTFVNYSSTAGTYDETSGLWMVGSILAQEVQVLLIDAIVNPEVDYENCAEITNLFQTDTNPANDLSCLEPEPIAVADLELTKEVDNLEPVAETNVDFTITLNNIGPSDATSVTVLDLLPTGYDFVDYSATIGTYDDLTGIWNVGSITANSEEILVITAYVHPIGEWTNVAEVLTSNELDLDSTPGNQDIFEDDMDIIRLEPIVELTIPEAFSPNNDGINDVFEIEHLQVLYPNFEIQIVNRWGNLVYKYRHGGNPFQTPIWWDGKSEGRWNFGSDIVPTGTYFYTIYFNNNEREPQVGWVYLKK